MVITTLGVLLFITGAMVALAANTWIIVDAFQQHIAWGLACLFSGVGTLIYVIAHWRRSKKAFLFQVAGVVAMVIGGWLMDWEPLFL